MFPNFIDRHTFGPNINYIYKMSVKYHDLSLHWRLPLKEKRNSFMTALYESALTFSEKKRENENIF